MKMMKHSLVGTKFSHENQPWIVTSVYEQDGIVAALNEGETQFRVFSITQISKSFNFKSLYLKLL